MSAHSPSVAVVTGANSGIGRATAIHLAQNGYRVFGTVRNIDKAAKAIAMASAVGVDIEWVELDIADHAGNQTRFVVVGRSGIPAPTGHDITGIVVYQRADEPGSLISILQEFAARRVNITNLLSRPTKDGGLGDYCFVMYLDGHIADELVADALRALHAKQGNVKFLGSYPAHSLHVHRTREHADVRWQQADDWIDQLRLTIQ